LAVQVKIASGSLLKLASISLRAAMSDDQLLRIINITSECPALESTPCTVESNISLSTIKHATSYILSVSNWENSEVIYNQEYTIQIPYQNPQSSDTETTIIIGRIGVL